MKYTHSAGEKSTVNLSLVFTEEEWKDAIFRAYKKGRGKYAVPGFRKGKVPMNVLENYYGKSLFFDDALNLLFVENYYTVIAKEKENFITVGDPELSVDEFKEGEGVTIKAVIPVKPEITIDAYTGLKIKKYEYNVTDAEVEKEVKRLGLKDAKETEVTDRASKDGDKVNIDFSGSVDGEVFPGGTAENYDLELGSGSFIPGFEQQCEGMKVGESKDINVKFPDDYQAENLRGKNAVFSIKLNKITEKQLPELTDEYVKAHTGCETLADYEKRVRDRLEVSAKNRSRDETENSIIAELSKHTKADIPQAMIDTEINGIVDNFSYRLQTQGLTLDEYIKYMGISMEDFRAQFADQALSRVTGQLIIDYIIKAEKIVATEEEVKEKFTAQAASVGKTYEEYIKNIDPRQNDYVKSDIIITKLFAFLSENNELYV